MWDEPQSGPPRWFVREIELGAEGEDVLIVQRKVDAPMTGIYNEDTAARVRGVQKTMGRKNQSGVVDAATAERLGEKPGAGQRPEWLECDEVGPGCVCPAVAKIRILIGQPNLPVDYDTALEDAVRRFQSAEGLEVTGRVNLETATLLADRSLQ